MPFKGDRRLGGHRRNDSTLNGTSDGPDFPALGTYILTLSNVEYPISEGGAYHVYQHPDPTNPPYNIPSQRCTIDVVADGNGGQFNDWDSARDIAYYPDGTISIFDVYVGDSIYEFQGVGYVNGYVSYSWGHDGMGTGKWIGAATFNTTSVFLQQLVALYANLDGIDYQVGNATDYYSHDGNGGHIVQTQDASYYPNYTLVGNVAGDLYTTIGPNNYVIGSYASDVISDGNGGASYNNGSNSYLPYGTHIAAYEGNNYYSDGMGGLYSVQFAPYGTATGNTNSGTNYIEINGSSYPNGTFSSAEYYDGNNGTYWTTDYFYLSSGTSFTSVSNGYDEEGNYLGDTYYLSDGNGGYYTE